MPDFNFYIIIILLAYIIYRDIMYDKRFDKLANKFMAKNFEQYQYYNEQYQGDLKTIQKLRETEFKKIKKEEGKGIDEDTEKFLSELEEDWRPETIDESAIKKMEESRESENDRAVDSER